MKKEFKKSCKVCHKEFIILSNNAKFCSQKCRSRYYYINGNFKKICKICGKEFKTLRYQSEYCSLQCIGKQKSKNGLLKKICKECGKEFKTCISANYECCSIECVGRQRSKLGRVKNICLYCKKEFLEYKNKSNKRKFCSLQCVGKQQTKEGKVIKICPICKKEFYVLKHRKDIITYCSRKCMRNGLEPGSYDLSFLDTDSPFRSWFLGWIMTDGCLPTNQKYVSLAITDKEIIDIICNKIGYKCKTLQKKKDGIRKDIHAIKLYKNSVKKLEEFGFKSGIKSGFEFIPNCMSKDTLHHFVRGCIEGDGSVLFTKRKRLNVRLCSLSESFLKSIWNILKENNLTFGGCLSKNKSNLYNLSFGHYDSNRICEYIYKDSDGLKLIRKYNKYLKVKDYILKSNKKIKLY